MCLSVNDGQVHISVVDEGCGFDPSVALSRNLNREHFGLRSTFLIMMAVLFTNLALLLCISVIPFPTRLRRAGID